MLKQLTYILNGISDPVLIVDRDFTLLALNEAASRRFSACAPMGSAYSLIRHPEPLECINAALRRERPGIEVSQLVVPKQPVNDVYRLEAFPLSVPDAGLDGAVVRLIDISRISEVEQVRRDFVANLGHELRSPVTSIAGFIEVLKGDSWDDKGARQDFLSIMEKETRRMVKIIDDLLTLSHVEAEERNRPDELVDVKELVEETVASLAGVTGKSGVELDLQCSGTDMSVRGDSEQLRQMIENILENAIKFSPSDSRVRVACRRTTDLQPSHADAIRIDVIDNGPGISPDHVPRLTERFYRVDDHRSRDVGGTGLGLAIVKHVLNRHCGKLQVKSKPGVGSRFSVLLPEARVD